MKLDFNLIKNKEISRSLAVAFIIASQIFAISEYIFELVETGFYFSEFFIFFFDLIVNGMLIFALLKKNVVVIEIALVILKVFEGTYYPINSANRLDALIRQGGDTFDIVNHIFFATFALSLLVALVFFIIHKVTNSISFWCAMKLVLLIANFAMIIVFILFCIQMGQYGFNYPELVGPISLSFLITGMFMTCEYVEDEAVYA